MVKKTKGHKSRGMALIIVFSMLMVISIAGLSLVRLSTIEKQSGYNYHHKVQSRLAAMAGIEYAIARLTQEIGAKGYLSPGEPPPSPPSAGREAWYYPHVATSPNYPLINAAMNPPDDVPNSAPPTPEATSVSYEDLASPLGNLHFSGQLRSYDTQYVRLYSLKIIDMGGQLNLNGHIAAGGAFQQASNFNLYRLVRSLATFCGFPGPASPFSAAGATEADQIASVSLKGLLWNHSLTESDIYNDTVSLPRRWNSKQELEDAVMAALGGPGIRETEKQLFLDNVAVGSWIDRSTCVPHDDYINYGAPGTSPPVSIPPFYRREARAPVNVNTASEELLAAMLWGLQAQPLHINNQGVRAKSGSEDLDGGSSFDIVTDAVSIPSRHRITILEDHANPDTNRARARQLAQKFIDERNNEAFKNWSDLNRFIDGLNLNSDMRVSIIGISQNDWEQQFDPNPPISGNYRKDVYEQTCRDILKANFNPNTIDNYFNPTENARFRAVKADMFASLGGVNACTHTTEFCFSSTGMVEISSLGIVLSGNNNEILGRTIIRAEVALMEIMRHSTQADFDPTVPPAPLSADYTDDVTSFPSPVEKGQGYARDSYVGRIEPYISQPNPPGIITYASNFRCNRGGTPESLTSTSQRFNSFPGGLATTLIGRNAATLPLAIDDIREGIRDPNGNNLVNDGILSNTLQYGGILANTRFFSIPGLDSGSEGARRGMNFPGHAYNSAGRAGQTAGDHVPYYNGAIELWVKLTEHSSLEMPCGLFSATLVNRHPAGDPDAYPSLSDPYASDFRTGDVAYSEGVQFYILKNNSGQLRISRIYFCLAFDAVGGIIGTHYTQDADAWNYNYNSASGGTGSWSAQANAPYRYFFPVPRRDALIDINPPWLPNTWHRLYVGWHDGDGKNGDGGLQVSIDGTPQTVNPEKSENDTTEGPASDRTPDEPDPEFSFLNERAPRDCMNICGIFRPQQNADLGLFWMQDPEVYFPGNATIANVRISLDAPDSGTNVFAAGSRYAYGFNVPNGGRLGTLSWTAYPGVDTTSLTKERLWVRANIYNGASFVRTVDTPIPTGPGDEPQGYNGEGLPLVTAGGNPIVVGANSRVEYEVFFEHNPTRNECAVLDDITLTVFKPTILNLREIFQ